MRPTDSDASEEPTEEDRLRRSLTPSGSTLAGARVGKYRIERRIGAGGMGEVYEAVHASLGTKAAVKVLGLESAGNPEVVRRFFNEARAAASIRHPNVVEIYDYDKLSDGRPYILLELLDGESLAERLARVGRLSPQEAVAILRQVCEGVGEAHRLGVVHRDLKPDNIFLVAPKGSQGLLVKVLDFGIAKIQTATDQSAPRTQTGMLFGTPEYMSPEQGLGRHKEIGPATDIYSAGITAYRMLAGRVPFPIGDSSFVELSIKHAQESPPPLRAFGADLPPLLEWTVAKALAKRRGDRWPSMEVFGRALGMSIDPASTQDLLEALARAGAISPFAATTPPHGIRLAADEGKGLSATTLGGAVSVSPRARSRTRLAWAGTILFLAIFGGALVRSRLFGASPASLPAMQAASPSVGVGAATSAHRPPPIDRTAAPAPAAAMPARPIAAATADVHPTIPTRRGGRVVIASPSTDHSTSSRAAPVPVPTGTAAPPAGLASPLNPDGL